MGDKLAPLDAEESYIPTQRSAGYRWAFRRQELPRGILEIADHWVSAGGPKMQLCNVMMRRAGTIDRHGRHYGCMTVYL